MLRFEEEEGVYFLVMESREYEQAIRLKNIETFREGTSGKINLVYNLIETLANGLQKTVVKTENFEVCDNEGLLQIFKSLRQKSMNYWIIN